MTDPFEVVKQKIHTNGRIRLMVAIEPWHVLGLSPLQWRLSLKTTGNGTVLVHSILDTYGSL